jgi:hypothetical protein
MLPYRYKAAGVLLTAAGLIMGILYFMADFRFELPVLAVLSSYAETKFLATFTTNFADELILLTLLAGFLLIVFTREKEEDESFAELRLRSAVYAVLINSGILVFSLLFLYGGAFAGVLIANMYTPFIFYLAVFYRLRSSQRKSE